MRTIGITGLKGSGKDTAAKALIAMGFTNVKMADGLKAMLRAYLAYRGVDDATIDRMLDGDLKEVPSKYFCGKTPRFAMQTLGTEWGRMMIGERIWTDATSDRCDVVGDSVLTDVRFGNEVDLVDRRGGVVVRVERPGLTPDNHPSEMLIQDLPVSAVIMNDGTVEELQNRLLAAVQ